MKIDSYISFIDLTPNNIRYFLSNLKQLTFEVTDACNLRCAYCGYHVYIYDDKGNKIEYIETPNTKFAERNVMWGRQVDARDRYRKIPYNPIELE